MMSHARSNIPSIVGVGRREASGVSATSRIRSILNVRIASRVSSQPIRYRAWVWSDGSIRYGRTRALRGAASGAYGAGA